MADSSGSDSRYARASAAVGTRDGRWGRTSDAGRKAIAEAVFERIEVLGARDFMFTLTAAAKARGWDAAFGPGVLRLEAHVVGARPRTRTRPQKRGS